MLTIGPNIVKALLKQRFSDKSVGASITGIRETKVNTFDWKCTLRKRNPETFGIDVKIIENSNAEEQRLTGTIDAHGNTSYTGTNLNSKKADSLVEELLKQELKNIWVASSPWPVMKSFFDRFKFW